MRLLPAGILAFGILPILVLAAFAQQEDQGFSVVAGGPPRALTAQAAPVVRDTLNDIPAPPPEIRQQVPQPASTPPLRRIAPPDAYGPQVIGFPDNVAGAFNVTYATLPGFRPLTLDLYTPRPSDMPRPLVVFVHGGSWDSGDSRHAAPFSDFPRALAALAAQGYVVASVNYRLSQEARYPAALQDVKSAIRWLRAHGNDFNIDTTRVAVWGASSGGQLAALVGTTCGVGRFEPEGDTDKDVSSDCVQAVIDWFGVTDFHTAATDAPAANSFTTGSSSSEGKYLGCEPASCPPGVARLASPLTFVSVKSPPFLIQHGVADTGVPAVQSQRLYDSLKAAGVPAQIVMYPNVGHGFARNGTPDADTVAQAMARLTAFLAETIATRRVVAKTVPPVRRGALD
jgi:acetyl esterase/lipase